MKPDKISSSAWLIIGILIVYFSFKMGIGNVYRPGPGFLTFWSGLIFCFLSLLVFFRSERSLFCKEFESIGQIWYGKKWKKTIIVALAILIYALVFEHLGFIISTFFLMVFLLRAIDPVKWKLAILGAILVSFLSFIIFDIWLKVQLPHKFLEEILFLAKRIFF